MVQGKVALGLPPRCPTGSLVVVGDRTYATLKRLAVCQGLAPPVTVLPRLRLDAVLHDPPPPRRPGQKGRPRIVGARQPSLQAVLRDPTGRRDPQALLCTDPDWKPTAQASP